MTGEPKGVRHHNVCMPGTLDQVRQGRRVLLGCLGADHPRVDDAVLMASETITNALVHTTSGASGGHFVLTVQWTGEWARVTVTDQGSATVPTRVAAAGAGHHWPRHRPHRHPGRPVGLHPRAVRFTGLVRRLHRP